MKLTNKDRWRYDGAWAGADVVRRVVERDEWITKARELLPNSGESYLELGCAPGIYTAALAQDTSWAISGVDYSEDAQLFLQNMKGIGKDADLLVGDMFTQRIPGQFDIVCSFGLVEHFRGESLEQVFRLHDSYVRAGGYLVIEMPNFTGFQYFWHYVFDRPDLDNHNVDVMQPAAMAWFLEKGYEPIFNSYVGVMRLWGNSGFTRIPAVGKSIAGLGVVTSRLVKVLDRLGFRFFRGRTWSPALLFVARKPVDGHVAEGP